MRRNRDAGLWSTSVYNRADIVRSGVLPTDPSSAESIARAVISLEVRGSFARLTVSFCALLDLRFCYRLPLHIGRGISASTFERNDVIHDVAPSGPSDSPPLHEARARRGAAFDLAVAAPFGDRRFLGN